MMSDTLPAGEHIGFLIIAFALLFLLGQLHLLNASADSEEDIRHVAVLRGMVIPLFIAFSGVILLEAIQVVA